jgi:hypothetical protein
MSQLIFCKKITNYHALWMTILSLGDGGCENTQPLDIIANVKVAVVESIDNDNDN